jgi:hypothetical protein
LLLLLPLLWNPKLSRFVLVLIVEMVLLLLLIRLPRLLLLQRLVGSIAGMSIKELLLILFFPLLF